VVASLAKINTHRVLMGWDDQDSASAADLRFLRGEGYRTRLGQSPRFQAGADHWTSFERRAARERGGTLFWDFHRMAFSQTVCLQREAARPLPIGSRRRSRDFESGSDGIFAFAAARRLQSLWWNSAQETRFKLPGRNGAGDGYHRDAGLCRGNRLVARNTLIATFGDISLSY
jgi:hypothetical protein